jgi:hypothetical protein
MMLRQRADIGQVGLGETSDVVGCFCSNGQSQRYMGWTTLMRCKQFIPVCADLDEAAASWLGPWVRASCLLEIASR